VRELMVSQENRILVDAAAPTDRRPP